MTRRPSGDTGIPALAAYVAERAAARAAERAAAQESGTPTFGPNAYARFLAVGDAHVIVAQDETESYLVTCESCGQLPNIGSFNPKSVTGAAQRHAETCRRIPERLWPEDGAL